MKLSIITVNLNNRDGLKRTIDSVVAQTFTDFEWIVIDGGSTDGSKELIEQYANYFVYWVSEPDKGIYNAMNKGIAHAKGEWLLFLNSGDCLYENSTLEKVFSSNHICDIIYGNAIVQIDGKDIFRKYPEQLSLSYLIKHPINHQASFYKRSLYKNHLFDERYVIISDYIYLLELALRDKRFEYIDLIIAYSEGGGISSTRIGVDESNSTKSIIPTLIQKDMNLLIEIEEHNRFINSHKSLKSINTLCSSLCNCAEKMIRKIERHRQSKNK